MDEIGFNLDIELNRIDISIGKLRDTIELGKAAESLVSNDNYKMVIVDNLLGKLVANATDKLINNELDDMDEKKQMEDLRFARRVRTYTEQLIVAGKNAKEMLAREEAYRRDMLNNQ